MDKFLLPGSRFDLEISFPWNNGIALSIILYERVAGVNAGVERVEMESWEKKIPPELFTRYRMYFGMGQQMLKNILLSKKK